MIGPLYFLIAVGCLEAGVGLWRSLCWPTLVGELIIHEARKRHILKGGADHG